MGMESLSAISGMRTSVYPRELVKEALRLNAAAVIVSHNHPSGNPEPSSADKVLTQRLKDALALVDVRTLDHIIVAGGSTISFAERGLICQSASNSFQVSASKFFQLLRLI